MRMPGYAGRWPERSTSYNSRPRVKAGSDGGTGTLCFRPARPRASPMKRLVIACLALLPAGCEREEPTFQGKPRSYWIQGLKSASSTTSMRAAHAVGHFAPEAREAIPDLIELLQARE